MVSLNKKIAENIFYQNGGEWGKMSTRKGQKPMTKTMWNNRDGIMSKESIKYEIP
jgi:hypothetical protein